jgi:hypothetical protein
MRCQCKRILHVCGANQLLIHHIVVPLPSQGKANKFPFILPIHAKVSVIALGFSNSIFKISNLKEKGIL